MAKGDQRSGFQLLQPRHSLQVIGLVFGLQIHHLATGHTVRTTRSGKVHDKLAPDEGIAVGRFIGQ